MDITEWYDELCVIGPPLDYHPEPEHYIGPRAFQEMYVSEKVDELVASVNTFTEMMPHQPQAAFAGYACSLQFKWAYLHRTIEIEERLFAPLEDAINKTLLPTFFDVQVPQDLLNITLLPVN
eukprot:3730182-Ditylum_brightwellii.AAC.1